MRQNNNNSKRSRGRHNNRKGGNSRNQIFDSNGPSVRIRGHALQIFEKYTQLSRDASTSGDRVGAENLQQHGEHYYRVAAANGAIPAQTQPQDLSQSENSGSQSENSGSDQPSNNGAARQNNTMPEQVPTATDGQNDLTKTNGDAPAPPQKETIAATAKSDQLPLNGDAVNAAADDSNGDTLATEEAKPETKPRRRGRRSRGAKSSDTGDDKAGDDKAGENKIESDSQQVA